MRRRQIRLRGSSILILVFITVLSMLSMLDTPVEENEIPVVTAGVSKEISDSIGNLEMQKSQEILWAGFSSFFLMNDANSDASETQKSVQKSTKAEAKAKAKKKQKKKGFPQYAEDKFLLAQIIYYEVGNCTRKDKILTGSVVINRARTKYKDFRNVTDFYEVLYQDDIGQQYATATIEKIEAYYQKSYEEKKKILKEMEECIEVADGLISGEIECWPEYVLDQSDFDAETLRKWGIRKLDIDGVEESYGTPLDYNKYR